MEHDNHNHWAQQVEDQRHHTSIVKEHIKSLDTIITTRLQNKIDGYFSGTVSDIGAGASGKSKPGLKRHASQPKFKNTRETNLWSDRNHQLHARPPKRPEHFAQDVEDYSESSGSTSFDSYKPTPHNSLAKQRYEQLAAPIQSSDLQLQLSRMRMQVSRTQQQQSSTNQNQLLSQADPNQEMNQLLASERVQLMATERDVRQSAQQTEQNKHVMKRNKKKIKRIYEIEKHEEQKRYKDQAENDGGIHVFSLGALRQSSAPRRLTLEALDPAKTQVFMLQPEEETNVGGDSENTDFQRQFFSTGAGQSSLQTLPTTRGLKPQLGNRNRRLLNSAKSPKRKIIEPVTTKAQSKPLQKMDKPGRQNRIPVKGQSQKGLSYLQKVQMGNQYNSQRQLVSTKTPSHMQTVMSKLTLFKKKIEIDDEQNRLGPNNKVNLPQHNSLYFNTNPQNLLLKKILDKNDKPSIAPNEQMEDSSNSSSSISSHSYRSHIARNELAMNNIPASSMIMRDGLSRQSSMMMQSKNAEKLIQRKSMAPVKDWTSTVTKRVQNGKYGVEATKRHYEREAAAKYIYNKFGVHLLTYNHMTRNDVIPMFGEHSRSTNGQIFDQVKDQLQNRKSSAMRSHFVTLKRDLKKQNLQMPKQLVGAEAERFVRKRIMNEQEAIFYKQTQEMMTKSSPSRSMSPVTRISIGQSPDSRRRAKAQQQPQSHKQQCRLQVGSDDDYWSDAELVLNVPSRPKVEKNMDNHEWQKTAFTLTNLRDLYAAKCLDLKIETDQHQFDKFCQHIVTKAKNRCLNLSNCYLKEHSAKVLARQFMMYNERISAYDISSNELGDNGISIISQALFRTSHIVHMKLDMNNIMWEGASYLSKALIVNNSLINLSLSSGKSGGNNRNRIMERGAYELSEALAVNKYLIILNLTGNGLGNESLAYLLPAIAQSNTIQSLNLSNNEITSGVLRQYVLKDRIRQGFTSRNVTIDDQFESLRPFKLSRGYQLNLKENKRQKFQTAYLIKEFIRKVKSIKEFVLKGNKLGDDGMHIIAEAFADKDRNSSNFKGNKLGVDGMHKNAEAFTDSNSSIKKLDLTQIGMTAESFRTLLVSLRKNHKLRTLIVDKNNLGTNYAFTAIKDVIAVGQRLRVLSAANCNLSDYFGKAFAEAMKSNRALTKFNFYGNMMTCHTLSLLAQALQDSPGKLAEFNMGKNHLKDKGGVKFGETLHNNNKLVKVNLSDNNFTDATALAINRNLPTTSILTELNLSMNLINLRQLEMIESVLAKTRDSKLASAMPNLVKQKQQFVGDRENARLTKFELVEGEAEAEKVEYEHQKLKQNFSYLKRRTSLQIDKDRKRQQQLDPIDLEMTELMANVIYEKRNMENNMELHLKNRQQSLDRLKDNIREMQRKLDAQSWNLVSKRSEYQGRQDKLEQELQNVHDKNQMLNSQIKRRTHELDMIRKARQSFNDGENTGKSRRSTFARKMTMQTTNSKARRASRLTVDFGGANVAATQDSLSLLKKSSVSMKLNQIDKQQSLHLKLNQLPLSTDTKSDRAASTKDVVVKSTKLKEEKMTPLRAASSMVEQI